MNTVGILIFAATLFQVHSITPVNVTVFYESLCPDSIRFVKKQLYPTYLALKEYMNVEFVPFGKAHYTMNPWTVTCQHGRFECYGNTVHACALQKYTDNEQQVKFIHCVMLDNMPPTAAKKCARKLKYSYSGIEECSRSEEGRHLLAQHGDRTLSFKKRLSFVPTMLFNGVYTERDQKDALNDLKSVICRKLESIPEPCSRQ